MLALLNEFTPSNTLAWLVSRPVSRNQQASASGQQKLYKKADVWLGVTTCQQDSAIRQQELRDEEVWFGVSNW